MGYTHHFKQTRAFTTAEWNLLCERVEVIFRRNQFLIRGPGGEIEASPEITEDWIAFNGCEKQAHESCEITKKMNVFGAEWCKTNGKPYDMVVVAVYQTAHDIAPDAFIPSSDGGEGIFTLR